MNDSILRIVRFAPYRAGMGPRFTLTTWDTGRTAHGRTMIGYRLKSRGQTIFEGEDFGSSPLHAIDSDSAIEGLMSFLTLRPGDTDREYFDNYTPEQLDFCAEHAESLAAEVACRFGDMT